VPEELHGDAVGPAGMLVKDKHNDIPGGQPIQNRVEPALLGEDAEARPPESSVTKRSNQRGCSGTADEVNAPAVLGEVGDPASGATSQVPSAGEHEDPLPEH